MDLGSVHLLLSSANRKWFKGFKLEILKNIFRW